METLYISSGFLFIFLVAFVVLFLKQGPQFVPSDDKSTAQMVEMVNKYKPKHILDLGSGDGKLVMALGKEGYKVDGVEIDPVLVLRSRLALKKAKLTNTEIHLGNMWTFDISKYDMIVVYVVQRFIPKLEKKLLNEMKPGTFIISNLCIFKDIPLLEENGRAKVFRMK